MMKKFGAGLVLVLLVTGCGAGQLDAGGKTTWQCLDTRAQLKGLERHVYVSIQLQLRAVPRRGLLGSSSKKEPTASPEAVEWLLLYFAGKTPQQLDGPAAIETVRKDILTGLAADVYPEKLGWRLERVRFDVFLVVPAHALMERRSGWW